MVVSIICSKGMLVLKHVHYIEDVNGNKSAMMENASPVHAVTGELTIAVVTELKANVIAWVADRQSTTLDLSGVSRVDCAGLQVIIAAARTGRVALPSLSLAVQHAMETIGYVPADVDTHGQHEVIARREDKQEESNGGSITN